jgi:superfamily II DNA/RNA helicase
MCKHGPNGITWLKSENKALDQYRHRAGRTARSLQKGVSITLILPDEEGIAREYCRKLRIGDANMRILESVRRDEIKQYLIDAQI